MLFTYKHSFSIASIIFVLALLSSCSSSKVQQQIEAESKQVIEVPALALSPIFSDHMVLQRNDHAAIFGTGKPHSPVQVAGSWGETARSFTDDTGEWLTKINTPAAGGPHTITISHDGAATTIADVMIGEVWLGSGQSNMEMPVKGWPPNDLIDNSAEEIANGSYPGIRMITVKRNMAAQPMNEYTGQWQVASPATVGDFSATAYFFAKRLHQELGIPVGIIHSSWGGTVAEAWTSAAKLKTLGDFDNALATLSNPTSEAVTKAWFANKASKPIPSTPVEWDMLALNDEAAAAGPSQHTNVVTLPGRFDFIGKSDIDGAFWLHKEITIDDVSSDYTLLIEAVDDIETTYVNGEKVGGVQGHNVPRSFSVPKSLLKRGTNTIAIRAIDTGGPGSVSGPMELVSSSSDKRISLEGDWQSTAVAEIYQGQFYIYDVNTPIGGNRPNVIKQNPNNPSVLFNAMINPLIPYSIKGALWYQGESNVGRDMQYRRLFPAMISDWRERWGDEFPFYFVQIAPYQYHGGHVKNDQSQKLREAQRRSLALDKTGMVVTMDIGNFTNIHPGNKADVGKRLASLALANDYGKDIVASGPIFKDQHIEGNTIVIDFDFVGSGLKAAAEGLSGFEVADDNGKFVEAKAKIVGNQVVVSADRIDEPKQVRYAWRDHGIATLFNAEGLPASSFRSY